MGPEAERFLDWAAAAGQTLWQILPIGPTGGGSPYTCLSAFAGNPSWISPERLVEEGFLPGDALVDFPAFRWDRVEFDAAARWKDALLRRSWAHFGAHATPRDRAELEAFRVAPERASWLAEWSLYAALKRDFGGRAWIDWEDDLARRDPDALRLAAMAVEGETEYQNYLQFLFFRQWGRLRALARERGIRIVGDIPI
jgi:4-alpha-glucanotransferase